MGFLREWGGGRKIFKENVVMRHCTDEVAMRSWWSLGLAILLHPRRVSLSAVAHFHTRPY